MDSGNARRRALGSIATWTARQHRDNLLGDAASLLFSLLSQHAIRHVHHLDGLHGLASILTRHACCKCLPAFTV